MLTINIHNRPNSVIVTNVRINIELNVTMNGIECKVMQINLLLVGANYLN